MATRQIKSTNYFSHDSNARNDEKTGATAHEARGSRVWRVFHDTGAVEG